MWKRLFLGIFILLAFEAGLFHSLFPWFGTWDTNYFINGIPALKDILLSPYARGAVSGLGLVNVFMAIGEAWHFRARIRDLESREAQEAAARLTLEKT